MSTTSNCPRCAQPFACGAAEGRCDCFELRLSDSERCAVAQAYTDCLCLRCLGEIVAGAPVQPGSPEPNA